MPDPQPTRDPETASASDSVMVPMSFALPSIGGTDAPRTWYRSIVMTRYSASSRARTTRSSKAMLPRSQFAISGMDSPIRATAIRLVEVEHFQLAEFCNVVGKFTDRWRTRYSVRSQASVRSRFMLHRVRPIGQAVAESQDESAPLAASVAPQGLKVFIVPYRLGHGSLYDRKGDRAVVRMVAASLNTRVQSDWMRNGWARTQLHDAVTRLRQVAKAPCHGLGDQEPRVRSWQSADPRSDSRFRTVLTSNPHAIASSGGNR